MGLSQQINSAKDLRRFVPLFEIESQLTNAPISEIETQATTAPFMG